VARRAVMLPRKGCIALDNVAIDDMSGGRLRKVAIYDDKWAM